MYGPLSAAPGGASVAAASACGVERWTVKDAAGPPDTPSAGGDDDPLPGHAAGAVDVPLTRLPFERRVFAVTAAVTLVRQEQDGDLHLVLLAGADHMIAEAPSPSCNSRATPLRREQHCAQGGSALRARPGDRGSILRLDHGQTGVAPNASELHPILAFTAPRGHAGVGRPD